MENHHRTTILEMFGMFLRNTLHNIGICIHIYIYVCVCISPLKSYQYPLKSLFVSFRKLTRPSWYEIPNSHFPKRSPTPIRHLFHLFPSGHPSASARQGRSILGCAVRLKWPTQHNNEDSPISIHLVRGFSQL